MTATTEELETVAKIIADAKIALLTTVTAEGQLVSRPLAVQGDSFDGDLWFLTQDPSDKTTEIAGNDQVNVAFESSKGYLSIAGTASVVHDDAMIDALWTTQAEAWFPDGRNDTVALIKVHAETAEYWASNEPKPVVLFKVAKAAVTGGTPDIGENRTVVL
ncbi:pyridoxamine 5'-phosphate oxidase family protein [Marisediminicola senii]|uniref:pyridoxamine 5'-phosphate oxidase family protein n=1 Tax=Marisediminicola senii TaxID=2711233 RepID=UPI0013EAA24F|nr:pyridoxamine 5'-phosphate oxidase family protein [Marisediminicola senii]